jgi:tRNA threonylcarbamoyladenosine biosynthesis protein TsaB
VRVLALDTATPLCGVAVLCSEGGLGAVRQEVVTTHSDRLLGLVAACLEEAGLAPRDLGGVVCGAGPGSFTGLRIGAATAKGLCLGLGVPLVMVSSLQVLAARHEAAAEAVLPCIDAWRGQVYAQLFIAGDGDEVPPALARPAAWEPAALRAAVAHLAGRLAVCGDGARRYPDVCPAGARLVAEAPAPDPLVLARLGLRRLLRGERDDLAAAVPDYACPSAAELNLPPDQSERRGPG